MGASVPQQHEVHAVIRQNGRYLMLYSEKYCYCKFPHGTAEPDETPEQALCRIVSAQTGMSLLPQCAEPCITICSDGESGTKLHTYLLCKVSNAPAANVSGSERFRLKMLRCREALSCNEAGSHGILNDDVRFQAMLNRENLVLHSFCGSKPLHLSILALIGSLLIPVICGISCFIFGFHSPTDGGYVYGLDAFETGLILGIFPAAPALTVSIAALLLSLLDKRRKIRRQSAYILPLTALSAVLLLAIAAFSFGNK